MTSPIPVWPLPGFPNAEIPLSGPGCFGEMRGDRLHCGLDLYAPTGSEVVAMEKGEVLETGLFTSPRGNVYWNNTWFVSIRTRSGLIHRYCELGDVSVASGQLINAGDTVGHVGTVLDLNKIDESAPDYIQQIKARGLPSMLHLELSTQPGPIAGNYSGGNVFSTKLPAYLKNPAEYLNLIKLARQA